MKFKTKRELIQQLKRDKDCDYIISWAEEQPSLKAILKNCRDYWRYCCMKSGYEQFAENCDWDRLDNLVWIVLLSRQPQYADRCDWSKLNAKDWAWLLVRQPQFVKYLPKTPKGGKNE